EGYFALAIIQGNVTLIHVPNTTFYSALTPIEVTVFQYEFAAIFRLLESRTLHPSDVEFLEKIDHSKVYYEGGEQLVLDRSVRQRMSQHDSQRRRRR
ncbi:hypothetical protein CPB84DRAFT_1690911, partial [Gymnopilus junonius]